MVFSHEMGGGSSYPFNSLNFSLKVNDSYENVLKNRQILLKKLNCSNKKLVTLNQVHSNKVIFVDKEWNFHSDETPQADALITKDSNIVLGVLTADCVPILLHDPLSNTVAAIHAGWRGLKSEIINKTIISMSKLGCLPNNINSVIGPCIHQCNYEVDKNIYDFFNESLDNIDSYFIKKDEKYLLDLPGLAKKSLIDSGVKNIFDVDLNTYSDKYNFFSCRRSFHEKEKDFGCQISAISIN